MMMMMNPCWDMAPTETCMNITIFWQPPNSPCTETDPDTRATQCANVTYHYRVPAEVLCDEAALQAHNTTGRAVSVVQADGSTRCYTSDPGGLLNIATFAAGAPLGADALSNAAAPAYPVPFNPNMSISPAWFAAPMDAYVMSDFWQTFDFPVDPTAPQYSEGSRWCLPGVVQCNVLQQAQQQTTQNVAQLQWYWSWQMQVRYGYDLPAPSAAAASDDNSSPPILCYYNARAPDYWLYSWDSIKYIVDTTDGGYKYRASKTMNGEQVVCASYRAKPLANNKWFWHYKVMPSSSCASLVAAASNSNSSNVIDGSGVSGLVADVVCCTTSYCNKPGECVCYCVQNVLGMQRPSNCCIHKSCLVTVVQLGTSTAAAKCMLHISSQPHAVVVAFADPVQDPDAVPAPALDGQAELTCYETATNQWMVDARHARLVTYSTVGVTQDVSPYYGRPAGSAKHTPGLIRKLCMKYFQKCHHNSTYSTRCSDEDIDAGVERWVYTTADPAQCANMVAATRADPNLHNVTCCTSSYCNAPDPTTDNSTTVIEATDPAEAHSSTLCHVNIAAGWNGQLQQPEMFAAFPMLFTGKYYQPGYSNGYPVNGAVYWDEFSRYQIMEDGACVRFKYMPCAPRRMTSLDIIGPYKSYQGCTQQNQDTWAWGYRRLSMFDCLLLKEEADPRYGSNVTCCTTSGCNAPLPEEDTETQQLATEPVPAAAATLTCYKSMDLGELIAAEVPPAVHPVTVDAQRLVWGSGAADPMVCFAARGDICQSDGQDCTLADTDASRWRWKYDVMAVSECYQQQMDAAAGVLQNISCCTTDLCNKPEPALDNSTQVSPNSMSTSQIALCISYFQLQAGGRAAVLAMWSRCS
jgi:hypothetical protein